MTLLQRIPVLELTGAVIVVALVRHGAFYPPDDVALPAATVALAAVAAARAWHRLGPVDAVVVGALAMFVLWWELQAAMHGSVLASRQLAGAAIGFAACYLVGRTLGPAARERLPDGALGVGTFFAGLGLVGLALRIHPLALPAQGHVRLAGTLTYSNATAALLAMLLVVGLTAPPNPLRDAQLPLVLGALLATQSRGGLVALLLGLLVVRRHLAAAVVPLTVGVALGVVAVAGSGEGHRQWELLVLIPVVAAVAAASTGMQRKRIIAVTALGAVALAALALAVSGGDAVRSRTGTASVSDRTAEWRAGWDSFTAHPVRGAGPGNRLQLADGRTARFVHNEPLQVAADSGLVGLGLLLVAAAGGVLLRQSDEPRHRACAALVVVGVSGLVDFTWHLPGIAMTAGLLSAGRCGPPGPGRRRLRDRRTSG